MALSTSTHLHCSMSEAAPAVPHDLSGRAIPQVLQERAWRGESISLSGHDWEPMHLGPAASSRELGKGSLHPADSVFVVIDMQPLFFDALSPWGVPATPGAQSQRVPCFRAVIPHLMWCGGARAGNEADKAREGP